MTFDEAGFRRAGEVEEPEAEPPVSTPAPEAVASEAPEGPPLDPVLLRFAAEARLRRARGGAEAPAFPADAAGAWRDLCAVLDSVLARPLPQTPLLELVRARVTVEAEWDYDLRRYGAAPPELAALVAGRVGRLAVRIDTGRAMGAALVKRPAPARLRWPVERGGISSLYGVRVDPLDGSRRMHRGLDVAAERGEPVEAAADGWVVRAGASGGYGLMVEVRHAGDVTTRYGHLSTLLCAPGEAVEAGQLIGLVGQTGRATGPHLHFEVWKDGLASDPLPWLGADRWASRAAPRPGASGGPR
jgi:murein DD-endopeptidase MepM/ murein hydrolase activator NlpD